MAPFRILSFGIEFAGRKGLFPEPSHDLVIQVPPVAFLPNFIVQQKALYPFHMQVGGTILAAKVAKERGWAINVGGGFHHCSAEKGGGFCAYADISLCIHFAFIRLNISRVMIIDLDAHQGNGHEMDFSKDGRVFILDMYNPEIYPFDFKARSYIDQRVEVLTGTTTDVYQRRLDEALEVQLSEQMMSNILFKKLGNYEIAWVDAEVGKMDSGMLSVLPASKPPPPHKSIFIGDLKLADFKQFLASKGIQGRVGSSEQTVH